jgi:hypothetical protein
MGIYGDDQGLGLRADHLRLAAAVDDAHDIGGQLAHRPLHGAEGALAAHLGLEIVIDDDLSICSHDRSNRKGRSPKGVPGHVSKTGREWGGQVLKVLKSVDLFSEIF